MFRLENSLGIVILIYDGILQCLCVLNVENIFLGYGNIIMLNLLERFWEKIVKFIKEAVEYLGQDFTGWWGM
jgi:hypothetical protein